MITWQWCQIMWQTKLKNDIWDWRKFFLNIENISPVGMSNQDKAAKEKNYHLMLVLGVATSLLRHQNVKLATLWVGPLPVHRLQFGDDTDDGQVYSVHRYTGEVSFSLVATLSSCNTLSLYQIWLDLESSVEFILANLIRSRIERV